LQSGLQGALGGGIVGGVNAFASTIFSSTASNPNIRFAAETLLDGVKNRIEKKGLHLLIIYKIDIDR